jgi:uncharacterized hydrophobic protein (TIGR00271 family)
MASDNRIAAERKAKVSFFRNTVDDNRFKPEDLPAFKAKLFFEGPKRRAGLERFVVLLFLSTLIATIGVVGNSTATVIGAMIIAPLMRPIMATAAGLVMGDMKRAGSSFLIVLTSVAGVIGTAWLLTELSVVTVISIEANTQFSSRTSPRLIDLYAALASGAAGAFAISREDVADSLPGVAIAISLVPPVCVAGIALAEGEWTAAGGAMLLFLTNFLSILLAGGGVLALLGLSAVAVRGLGPNARRGAFLVVALGIILVTIPLGTTTLRIYQQKLIKRETIQLAEEWVDRTGYGLGQVDVRGDSVTLAIYGSGERPKLSVLGDQLSASLDQPVDIRLVVVPSEQEDYAPTLE